MGRCSAAGTAKQEGGVKMFGDNLKEARLKKLISQEELAAILGDGNVTAELSLQS